MRIRWWLQASAVLTILGVLWLGRRARNRWEPVFLVAGAALTAAGVALPVTAAFFAGLLVLIATLLKGIASQRQGRRLS